MRKSLILVALLFSIMCLATFVYCIAQISINEWAVTIANLLLLAAIYPMVNAVIYFSKEFFKNINIKK